MTAKPMTANVTQHNAKCSCGTNMSLMPGMARAVCERCNVRYDLPELTYQLDVTIVGEPLGVTAIFPIGSTVRIGSGRTVWTVRGHGAKGGAGAEGMTWLTAPSAQGRGIQNRHIETSRITRC